jgi:hypothetical protein
MKKIFAVFLRIFFGLYLILLGLKGLSEVNINKNEILKTIDAVENRILKPYDINLNLHLLKQHPIEILYFENISILYSGFLLIFGLTLSKSFLLIGFLIEFVFQKNLFFDFSINKLQTLSILASMVVSASNFN